MQITINTDELSELDKKILHLLTGGEVTVSKGTTESKPAAKATKAAKAETNAKPEPESAEGLTLADAVDAATKLVSNGEAVKVKEALAAVGAKRVSELSTEDIPKFMEALA